MAGSLVDLQLLYGIAGAREQFENLCGQLIRSQSPTATGIRVHRGDGGIDVYEGKFTGGEGIHVFQVKYFPNGIGKSQRNEVRESFTRCRTNTQFTTKRWTLCLPVDLSVEETEWFSKWVQEQAQHEIDIDWRGATQLEGLLYHADNRGIKEAFFKEEYLTQIREMHGMLMNLIDDITTRLGETSGKAMKLHKDFRDERLAKIIAGEMPAKLDEKAPKIVLHVIPFGAFDPTMKFNMDSLMLADNIHLTRPLSLHPIPPGYTKLKYNVDGLLHDNLLHDSLRGVVYTPSTSYTQVFRNGTIESVDTSILGAWGDDRITRGDIYEPRLLEALKRFLAVQKQLGGNLPLIVMISLLGVQDFRIGFSRANRWPDDEQNHRIDRPDLVMPEAMIDSFDDDLPTIMKPIFDNIAQAANWPRSMMYDESGESLHTNL